MRFVIILATAVLLSACNTLSPSGETAIADAAQEFEIVNFRWQGDIDRRTAITVVNNWGDLRVRTNHRGPLYATATIQKIGTSQDEFEIRIDTSVNPARVEVTPIVRTPGGRVDLVLMIPPGLKLDATTLDGFAELKYSGDITARTRAGKVFVKTTGQASVRSKSGDMRIALGASSWERTQVFETAGNIDFLITPQANGVLNAQADSNIEYQYPDDAPVKAERDGKRMSVTFGDGGTEVRARSRRGNISIRPLAPG